MDFQRSRAIVTFMTVLEKHVMLESGVYLILMEPLKCDPGFINNHLGNCDYFKKQGIINPQISKLMKVEISCKQGYKLQEIFNVSTRHSKWLGM